MLFLTSAHFAENSAHSTLNRVRAIIRECREMTKTELVIRTPFLKGRRRERDEILCEPTERRETEVEQDLSGGRPRTIIRWIAA